MKNPAKASDLSLIEPVISKYKNTSGSLITVLQEIQDIYGYLPEDALCHAAIEMGIAPATVFGVATFYAQFRFTPYNALSGYGVPCQRLRDDRESRV